jgi:uncharacterized RDD family membrane protein YckC
MADQWYVGKGGKKHGPFTNDQLKKLAADGKIDRTDLLWKEGMEKWVPCSSAKGLFSAVAAAPLSPSPPPPAFDNPLAATDRDDPTAAFSGFEMPAYVPTPEEPPPPKPIEAAPTYKPIKAAKRLDYAGLGARFVAAFLDSLVFSIPVLILFFVLVVRGTDRQDVQKIALITQMGMPFVAAVYGTLMESGREGATLGKRAMSIRVTDLEGRPIGLGKALMRNIYKAVPMVLFIGAILVLILPRKQGAHDIGAGTVVVKT